MKSDLINDREDTEKRMVRSARAMVEAWYLEKGEVVFDKCRAWNNNSPVLQQLFPEAQMFLCVRDLRSIFGSIEKQHSKNPLLDDAQNPLELTQYNRADRMFGPQGMIGQQLVGIEDMLGRNPKNKDGKSFIHVIPYESFIKNPQLWMDKIYSLLGESSFEHDFEKVDNTATDVDGLYHYKFPHKGEGKVEDRPEEWAEHISPRVAGLLMERFSFYNKTFGYQ